MSAAYQTTKSEENWRDSAERRLQLLRELRRRQCRGSLEAWSSEALAPFGERPAAHHKLLIGKLEAVERGEIKRLMINLPPGSAKTTYATVLFPPWYLCRRPNRRVICASNTTEMAEEFSARSLGFVNENIDLLGYTLTRMAVGHWDTGNGGTYRAVGVGKAIAGKRADLVIIDDPIRSREDAESEVIREKQWAWLLGDVRTRLKPGGAIILVMTRWNPDDLGGRVIEYQGDLWDVVNIPAEAEAGDPLGREPGEFLWEDDDYGYAGELRKVKSEYERAGASRDWNSLYQQKPTLAEGNLFKIGKIDVLPVPVAGGRVVRAWDLAATAELGSRQSAYTAGVKLALMADGKLVVVDVQRARVGPDEQEELIVNTAKHDTRTVTVGLPQDPGQSGKVQVLYLTRALQGFSVESSPESGDKADRAMPIASQVNVGNMAIVKADWNAPFLDELANFPSGKFKDQVDALSRAYGMLIGGRAVTISDEVLKRARERTVMARARL